MPKKRRTIAVVSGSRAEFGLLEPVMRAIEAEPLLNLRLVLAGAHWVSGTWRDAGRAGFRIAARLPMQRRGEVGRGEDVRALGRGVMGFGKVLARLRPDVVLVLGDRIEALAAALAAAVGGWRLGHLHGGDRAEGVADESMRHAISKLAHLHFPATAQSRRRLIRLGEEPAHIFLTGSPAADGLDHVEPDPAAPQILVVQHPIGASDEQERKWMLQTLAATRPYHRLVLAPNADPGSRGIRQAMKEQGIEPVEHLPRARFLALLAGCRAIVGNSSAGLIESAVLRTPAVNIGPRQQGRQRPRSVVNCDYGRGAVEKAIARAMKLNLRTMKHPYGGGDCGRRIATLLATIDLESLPLRKQNTY